MGAARPGSTFQPTPPQGGKGGGAVQPTQPQTPYTPIGSQGGKGGRGPIQPQPVQPTQPLPLFNNGVNDAFTGIPGQGGKTPLPPELIDPIPVEYRQPINPRIPVQGGKGNIPAAINAINQTAPRSIAPVVQAVAQNIPAPQQVRPAPQPVQPAPAPVQTRGPVTRNMQPAATQGLAALMNRRR